MYVNNADPWLQVLTGVRDRIDGSSLIVAFLATHQGANEDNPFTLLTGDPCPVIGVGGIGKVFVFTELINACSQ